MQQLLRVTEDTKSAADAAGTEIATPENILRAYANRLRAGDRHAGRTLQIDADLYIAQHREAFGIAADVLPGWCSHVVDS